MYRMYACNMTGMNTFKMNEMNCKINGMNICKIKRMDIYKMNGMNTWQMNWDEYLLDVN